MAPGKRRRERQLEAVVAASDSPKSSGHPFCTALNRLLAGNGFDPLVDKLRNPYCAETIGRPGVPLGVFFRMLFAGHFEGLESHASISLRCTDSRSLGDFLGLGPTEPVPNHSCVSKAHKRLPEEEKSVQGLRALLQTACMRFERPLSALDRVVAALVAPMATWSRAIGG
jgi:hypothetical protein